MAVLGSLLIVAGAWVLFSLVGMCCIALLPSARHRAEVMPAAPAIGVLGVIVVLHWTSWLLGAEVGAVIALLLCAVALWHPLTRARLLQPDRRALLMLAVCGALALPIVAIGVLPQRQAPRPTVVQPTPNNDAYAFVTEADWLLHHNAIEEPGRVDVPIGYQYVRHHIDHGLRIGQELAIDTVATVSRQPVDELYWPMTVLWLALIPGVVVAAGGALGMRRNAALIAGVVLSLGALEGYQLFNENSAAALGVAVAPLALAAVADALDLLPGRERFPLLVAPLVLAGVVGAYAEYTPLLLPLFVLVAVVRVPLRSAVSGGVRLAMVLALSIAVSPLAWWHAARGTLFHIGEPFLGWVSPFLSASPRQFAVRWIGGGDLVAMGADASRVALLVFAAALVGIACAGVLAPRRRLWASLLVASALLVTYLSTLQRITYSEQRAVLYSQPLLLLAAAAGFDALLLRLRPVRERLWRDGAVLAVAIGVVAFTAINAQADLRLARPDVTTLAYRTVDDDFRDAAAWVQRWGGRDGENALVASGDFFDQLWLAYALRNDRRVSWATFEPAYVDIGPCRYSGTSSLWSALPRRWVLLVDRQSIVAAQPRDVLARNHRFEMVRTGDAPVTVAVMPRVVPSSQPGVLPVDGSADMLLLAFGDYGVPVSLEGRNDGSGTAVLVSGSAQPEPEELIRELPGPPRSPRYRVVGQREVDVPPGRRFSLPFTLPAGDLWLRVEVEQRQPAAGPGAVLDGLGTAATAIPPTAQPPGLQAPPPPCD